MRTGAEQAAEDGEGVGEFVTFIRYFLLAFGGIALFVGAFVIFNTLSITVAQRTKELATLRTLGASRRQVLRSVILEGTILGLVASAVGLGLGVLLAKGLTKLFAAVELELPQSAMVFQTRTAVVAILTGTLVTLVASVWPAVRATRIAPIAAVREGGMAVKRQSRKTLVFGLVVTGLSVFGLVYGTLGSDVSTGVRILGIAGGAFGIFIGLAAIAPRLVRPLAHVVGLPAARLGGAAGRLAQENAVRNPGRTASTAAALMIGLTLVSFVAVFGKGLLASDESALRKQLGTSHVITSQSGWDSVPLGAGEAAAAGGRRHAQLVDPRRPGAARRARARRPSAASTRRRSPGRTTSSGSKAPTPRWRRSPTATRSSARATATSATRSSSSRRPARRSRRPSAASTRSTATSTSCSATSSSRRRRSTRTSRGRATC